MFYSMRVSIYILPFLRLPGGTPNTTVLWAARGVNEDLKDPKPPEGALDRSGERQASGRRSVCVVADGAAEGRRPRGDHLIQWATSLLHTFLASCQEQVPQHISGFS